ncbi:MULTISPECIES: RNA polymerase sigma factor [Arthrobacter]|uniref:Sigma-70 family RNA polymerase sigma factor n=1 Tax=Arthrobacter terricola TaxID=2547396 RepID=A0A4R5K6M1_9MICC|nr:MULTISPECIES: sigma-70 family RNA polymerase sigma factor [Arthrobacter]MBT8159638.1 sigma-70 family RNA polymerase sigma factor [Arthrobacter sp. GN70]TDF87515.1 sigma-70 family RNA polymerase sigma factor [Arthrobacter terricola]
MSSSVSDQVLWDRSVAGDADAFGDLFVRHRDAVYNYCFRRTASWDAAEDLTSAVFLEVWRGRRQLSLDRGSALPWLIGTASNLVRSRMRSAARRFAIERRAAPRGEVTDPADDLAEHIDSERQMAVVLAAIRRLPRGEQEVLAACVFAELDYKAAAAALHVPIGTVRSRLSRARARLQETNRPQQNEGE